MGSGLLRMQNRQTLSSQVRPGRDHCQVSQGWVFREERDARADETCPPFPFPWSVLLLLGRRPFGVLEFLEGPINMPVYSESGRGNRKQTLTPLFRLVLGIFLRGGWLS